jgi:transcriptional regulator with GAF, ATPase, and Fis domain
MTNEREGEVINAFVSLAGALTTGYDVVDLLNKLTSELVRLLDVSSAGLLLADGLGVLHVVAASSEDTRQLELFQLQRDEGPCLDCYRTGEPVSVPNLAEAADRWPQFVAGAQLGGFASLHALPMRLRENFLGALGLFGTTAGALNDKDLALGQALADVASIALVQEKIAADKTLVTEQLQTALNSRVVIEQAKGVIAQIGQLDMAAAFGILRGYSRDHNLRLTDLARAVVAREMVGQDLIDHAATRRSTRSPR